jgi:hypothetical protein
MATTTEQWEAYRAVRKLLLRTKFLIALMTFGS